MNLEYIPLLRKQRELQGMPRGMERFRAYLATMVGQGDDIVAPLVAINPMGKDHVTALLDDLLASDCEAVGERAAHEAAARLAGDGGSYRISLVVVDDAQGGWTDRYTGEMGFRFARPAAGNTRWLRQPWLAVPLWSADEHTPDSVRRQTMAVAARAALMARHGAPITLRTMLGQEGLVYAFAGLAAPPLDAEEHDYARDVLEPYGDATEYPTLIACIWGDDAAASLGYASLGLPPSAGLSLAATSVQRRLAELELAPEHALTLDPATLM